MSLVHFELLPQCWSSEWRSLSKSVHGRFERNCLWLQQPSVSLSHNSCWFLPVNLWGLFFHTLECWPEGPGVGLGPPLPHGGTSTAKIFLPIFNCRVWVWGPPVLRLCPSYQFWCGFFIFLVVGLLFTYILGSSEWRWFCILVVILMWLWEDWSIIFTHTTIVTRTYTFFLIINIGIVDWVSVSNLVYTQCLGQIKANNSCFQVFLTALIVPLQEFHLFSVLLSQSIKKSCPLLNFSNVSIPFYVSRFWSVSSPSYIYLELPPYPSNLFLWLQAYSLLIVHLPQCHQKALSTM